MARKLSMGDLRGVFERIYPTAKHLHMNIISIVLLSTDFKQVQKDLGIHYRYYEVKAIRNGCQEILDKQAN